MSGETVFSKAADLIREHGWCQDRGRDQDGRVCVSQALRDAGAVWWSHAGQTREGRLVDAAVGAGSALPLWNDAEGRTVEDVLLLLKHLHVQAGGS